MNREKQPSSVNPITGRITFSDEPLWYRIEVIQLAFEPEHSLKKKNGKNKPKNKKRDKC